MNSTPKTLMQLSGADLTPASLSQSTIVIIDAQNEYVDGTLALPDVQPALAEITDLLSRARKAGAPIIHVQHAGRPGGMFDVTGHTGDFAPAAKPQAGEDVVRKGLPNAFANTNLRQLLDATGRKKIIMAGFMTHMCISATARSALDHGFGATVIAAASATRPLPDPVTGEAISARQIHRTALAELADRFAIVARSVADIPD